MTVNNLRYEVSILEYLSNQVAVEECVREKVVACLDHMLAFAAEGVLVSEQLTPTQTRHLSRVV